MMINNYRIRGEIIKAETIKNGLFLSDASRFIIKLDDTYPTKEQILNHNPLIRSTRGTYFIKYEPEGSDQKKDKLTFVVGNDLVGFKFKVRNSDHFEALAKVFPEVAWLLRNTNYDPKLFLVAKMHPGMIVPFSLNIGTYVDRLVEQMNRDKIDFNTNKPLVTYRVRKDLVNYNAIPFFYAPDRIAYAKKIIEMKKLAQACKDEDK